MPTWERRLAEAGCRVTASRRAIMQALSWTSVPLTPREIWESARQSHRELGLVTVYRMLNLLCDLQLARRVHRHDGCHGYLPASLGHHHALICQRCGRSVEFRGGEDIDTLIERVEAKTGYHIDEHLLQFLGTCPDCGRT